MKSVEYRMLETRWMLQYKSIPTLIWTDSSLGLDKSDNSSLLRCYVASLGK
jgi:hypothetical protein